MSEDAKVKNCVEFNPYDVKDYKAYLDPTAGGEGFKDSLVKGEKQLATFDGLHQDLFVGLVKQRPKVVEKKALEPTHAVNMDVMQRAMDSSTWERLRVRTKGSPDTSAMATIAMTEEVLKALPQEIKDEVNKQVKNLKDASDAMRDGLEEKAQAAIEKALQQHSGDMQVAAKAGLEKGLKEAEEYEGSISGWGTEPGTMQKMPWKERLALSKRVRESRRLKGVADLIGRFKVMALSKVKERTRDVATEFVGVAMGRNLSRTLPSGMLGLVEPDLEVVFLKDYAEASLLEYEVHGKQTKGRGPVIVCIDESGSMTGDLECWAKAVAIALATIAHKEKRTFHCIHFSDASSIKEQTIAKDASEQEYLQQSIVLAETFLDGGTSFEEPLRAALARIRSESTLKEADVVFITDGVCQVSQGFLEEWHKEKLKTQFSVVGIQVGGQGTKTLKPFCDTTLPLVIGGDVGDNEAEQVFALSV